jgi:enediyne polyketide synthase
MSDRIAVVGIACRYPDANSREELWDNVLAGRRAFRRLPDERMNQADYYSPDPHAPDKFYSPKAAVLRDYEFDRVTHKIAGSTFRSTDLTHWLALDVAAKALADAGFPGGEGLPKQATGVVIGNSLTGEFSRANLMRLRWPYVRRTVGAALTEQGWTEEQTNLFLAELEPRYKAPYPPIDEDTLAGGLANTIAGRICNYFDLHGGGYTVDGACSSSLLSVATAAKSLAEGDIDVALAGGVDLSIDPFEVIGFAKTGALATGEMRVYDKNSCGFWPGEGAGMIVLMREKDALERGLNPYALITGWGISSDGKGGITRPEAAGHRLALTRAYRRAGYGVASVSYFEGHGTGTELGDATELEALSTARRDADPDAAPALLSTVKGNIGHTKAAAGVAGLIKAILAVHHQVIPPATGHVDPHPKLLAEDAALRVPRQAELWPADAPIRAGVSAMGFGGINTHIALEEAHGQDRRTELDERTRALVASRQDTELLLFDAADLTELRDRVAQVGALAAKLSFAELADLAGTLAGELSGKPIRAAVVAANPEQAAQRLSKLLSLVDSGARSVFAPADGLFVRHQTNTQPKIAFLFPGQGSGRGTTSALRLRFAAAEEIFAAAGLPTGGDQVATEVAQPRIVTGSLAGLRVLNALGITADTAVGHSLGELSALHWGGALDEAGVLRLAHIRGQVMANASQGGGAMAGIAADADTTAAFLRDEPVVIAGYNGPHQTVVSGPADAVDRVCALAASVGFTATRINVSHAFHSPLVAPAAEAMTERLAGVEFGALARPVVSTVTAEVLEDGTDLRALLRDQVVEPVRFHAAAGRAVHGADLAIEVGPGRVLTGLLAEIAPQVPALPMDTDGRSLAGVLTVVGAAWTLGAPVRTEALFADRLIRPLPLDRDFQFLASPCESAPLTDLGLAGPGQLAAAGSATTQPDGQAANGQVSTLDLLRRLAAERVELPLEAVRPDTHPLDDLHLSSITVGQLVNQVVKEQGRPALASTSNFATVTIGDLARMIDELADTEGDGESAGAVAGVEPWVRAFDLKHLEAPAPRAVKARAGAGSWTVFAPAEHPLAERVADGLRQAGVGDGVLLCLPAGCEADHVGLFLTAAREVLAAPAGTRFVVVQHGRGAAGLAKTLHLEAPQVPTTVVDLADLSTVQPAVERVVVETAATSAFSEVHYAADGTRTVPVLTLLPERTEAGTDSRLGPEDVVLVTGGGKGITAECALAMARDSGAKLALLGRAHPEEDEELAANLARMTKAGVHTMYLRADVTSAEAIQKAVAQAESNLGPVTAVLHGAGRNEPVALTSLDEDAFRRTLAPKIDGLRAVLAAVDPEKVKLLITFGSIIGRAGLRGEAHYATANDWMTELTVDWERRHPHCRALALEWSVWSGAGMGERLGVVEALIRDGITPIPADEGIAVLRRVLADESVGPVVVVTGRIEGLPTVRREQSELPLLRFVDRTMVHYPGIELVTETDLSAGSDPYLSDHLLDGDLLFPAVIGMEAMTQVATAVSGHTGPPVVENAEFLRPIAVPPTGTTTIRLAALVRSASAVDLVIRSADTGFAADHFRATLRFGPSQLPAEPVRDAAHTLPAVPVDPISELYGGVLFQGKRFQKLLGYRRAAARQAVAEVASNGGASWFAAFLPQDMLLADPGARDVMMHAIQCCVPDATLLPESVERLHLADPATREAEYLLLDARERVQHGDSYIYDLDVLDPSGVVVERWEGLRLRAVRKRGGAGPWVPSLLGSYLERSLEAVLDGTRAVVVEPDTPTGAKTKAARRAQTELAVSRALGRPVTVSYRPDGKPEIDGGEVSASHGAGLTLVVAGAGQLTCDVETAVERTEGDWAGLLGPQLMEVRDQLTGATGEGAAVTATRVWAAMECVRKTGAVQQSLAIDRVHREGWVSLSAGSARVATWVTTITGRTEPVVFAVLVGREA